MVGRVYVTRRITWPNHTRYTLYMKCIITSTCVFSCFHFIVQVNSYVNRCLISHLKAKWRVCISCRMAARDDDDDDDHHSLFMSAITWIVNMYSSSSKFSWCSECFSFFFTLCRFLCQVSHASGHGPDTPVKIIQITEYTMMNIYCTTLCYKVKQIKSIHLVIKAHSL